MTAFNDTLTIVSNDANSPREVAMTTEVEQLTSILSFASLEGSGDLFGITEFGDLSDPPKKFLNLYYNNQTPARQRTPATPIKGLRNSLSDRVNFNTAGTKTKQISVANFEYNPVTDPAKFPLVTGTGSASSTSQDSFENVVYGSNWTGLEPIYTKEARQKYFAAAGIPLAPDEDVGVGSPEFIYASHQIGSTTDANKRTQVFAHITWTGFQWQIRLYSVVGVGFGTTFTWYIGIIGGDQAVGDFAGTDGVRIKSLTPSGGLLFLDEVFEVPPDISIRFLLTITGEADGYLPYLPGTADELADVGLEKLSIYLPSADSIVREYREYLGSEDTIAAALNRGSPVFGTESIAFTTSFTGGITAESHTPIAFAGRTVTASLQIKNLVVGDTYRITATFTDEDIGGGSPVESQTTLDFTAVAATEIKLFPYQAPVGKQRQMTSASRVNTGTPVTPPSSFESEVYFWQANVIANGGTLTANSMDLANDLILAMKARSYYAKLDYVLPFLGADLLAALVPLFDVRRAGPMTNINFVDADFGETTGLQGDGTTKRLTCPFTPFGIAGGNGGVGLYAIDSDTSGDSFGFCASMWSAPNTSIFGLEIADANTFFSWGNLISGQKINFAHVRTTIQHTYGQRSASNNRRLFIDGVFRMNNVIVDAAVEANALGLPVMGDSLTGGVRHWAGLAGIFYTTAGTLTDGEATDLHTDIAAFIAATGR